LRTRALRRGGESEQRLQALLAGGAAPAVPTRTWDLGGAEMTFALVPPGKFWMGSVHREPGRDTDESPRHKVDVKKGFWLGVYPVTQSQWTTVMGSNLSTHQGEDRPAHGVGWRIFLEFLTKLGERLGRTCRSPTEAEWEYACRAGTTSPFHTGAGKEALQQAGWCSLAGPPPREPRPVGQLLPNAFGLYDMHGNVWEWCSDWYSARYDVAENDNTYRNVSHAMRGGSWDSDVRWCRSAARNRCGVDYQFTYLGCRICLDLE
jgi:formylglycine-generating enzyme required for sulfatase activity